MNVIKGKLDGLLIIEPNVFEDSRGHFLESWNASSYGEFGIPESFTQDGFSVSRMGVLRGLHSQNPHQQGRLVSVLNGEVFDVAVDLRRNSPTFGHWSAVTLSAKNKLQIYVPCGFAHGFAVVSDTAIFHYKCTDYYAQEHEFTIRWDDPDIAIAWPFRSPILSAKDATALYLRDIPDELLFY